MIFVLARRVPLPGVLSVPLVPVLCYVCIILDLVKDFFSIAFTFLRVLTHVLEVQVDVQSNV